MSARRNRLDVSHVIAGIAAGRGAGVTVFVWVLAEAPALGLPAGVPLVEETPS